MHYALEVLHDFSFDVKVSVPVENCDLVSVGILER